MNRRSRKAMLLKIVLPALVLGLFFQNCSPTLFSGQGTQPQQTAQPSIRGSYGGSNGGGYDGKPYILSDLTKRCTDGDHAEARILEKNGSHQLVRWNCANLSTAQVVAVTTPKPQAPGSDSIVYKARVFDSETQILSGAQSPTKGFCTEVTQAADLAGFPQPTGNEFGVSLALTVKGSDLMATMTLDDDTTSDSYMTSALKIGTAPLAAGPLSGTYAYQAPNGSPVTFSLNFVNGEAVALLTDVPAVDTDTPSATGTVADFDSTLTKCTWN